MAKSYDYYVMLVDRKDQGEAGIGLWGYDGTSFDLLKSAAYAGWDDAIPWSAGTYGSHYKGTRFDNPDWVIDTGFTDRLGIEMHAKLKLSPKSLPISYGSYGCIVADGTFLKAAKKIVGGKDLQFQVVGFDPSLSLTLTSKTPEISEGETGKLTVNLVGDSTGVSKDCYVRVRQVGVSGQNNAPTNKDYKFDTSKGMRQLTGHENNANHKDITTHDYFIKIKKGSTSADIILKALGDKKNEGAETCTFKIIDYYFDSPNKVGGHRYYSDYAVSPKVLIKNSSDVTEDIKINDVKDLGNLNINKSGGIEGFHQTCKASKSVTYKWSFDAFTIPDSISISDNTGSYVSLSTVSGVHSGSFKLHKGSNGLVKIDVVGSSSTTTWNLSVSKANKAAKDATVELKKHEHSDDNTIYGTNHADKLIATETGNVIVPKQGNDILTAGLGSDTFVFGKDFGRDTIKNFNVHKDTLDFSRLADSKSDLSIKAINHGEDTQIIVIGEHDFHDKLVLHDVNAAYLAHHGHFLFA